MAAFQRDNGLLFREVQHMRQWWAWAALLLPSLAGWAILFSALQGGGPDVPVAIVMWILIGLGLPVFAFALRLIVEVRQDSILVRFQPLMRRRIALDQIADADIVRYRPIREYLGWGIRMSPRNPKGDIAYTMSGDEGVRLTLESGKQVLLGSRKAADLAAAIDMARSVAHAAAPIQAL